MRLGKKKPQTHGDALVAISEVSPEALKVVGDVMEHSKEQVIAQLEQQLANEQAAHAQTKQRLNSLQYELTKIRWRIMWLAGDPLPDETIEEIVELTEGTPRHGEGG